MEEIKYQDIEEAFKKNLYDFLFKNIAVQKHDYVKDMNHYKILTKEIYDKIIDLHGEDWFHIEPKNIGEYVYMSNFGEPITDKELFSLQYDKTDETDEKYDISLSTKAGLEQLIDDHYSEYLGHSSEVLHDYDIWEIMTYTVLCYLEEQRKS